LDFSTASSDVSTPSRDVPTRGLRLLNVAASIAPEAGGASEVILRMSRALTGLGHEVETLTVDDPKSAWASSLPISVQLKGPPHGRLQYSYEFHSWLNENAARFDAILTHGLWLYNSRAVRRAARAADRPYFVFPHGMLDPWLKRRYWGRHIGRRAYWWLTEEAVLRDATAVIFAGEEERDLARKSFRPYRCVERVVPLGADEPPKNEEEQRRRFSEKFPELAGKRLLLFLGRLHEKKGCGMLTGDLKWGALHAAEAFVRPSHQESFGVAVIEALACGTPVLLSHAVNAARAIETSGSGLVEADTLAGCSRLLERWLALPQAERRAMAENATECYRQKFEIAQAARRLVETLREFVPGG
jgi:glycosyltransferase involved in cell wall biosynthesis